VADVLVPFGNRWLAMSRETFTEALAAGDQLMPATQPAQAEIGPQWLTVQALAKATGVSTRYWYEQIRTGHCPSQHFGTSVRVPRSFLADIETTSIGRNGAGQ